MDFIALAGSVRGAAGAGQGCSGDDGSVVQVTPSQGADGDKMSTDVGWTGTVSELMDVEAVPTVRDAGQFGHVDSETGEGGGLGKGDVPTEVGVGGEVTGSDQGHGFQDGGGLGGGEEEEQEGEEGAVHRCLCNPKLLINSN